MPVVLEEVVPVEIELLTPDTEIFVDWRVFVVLVVVLLGMLVDAAVVTVAFAAEENTPLP